MQICVAPNIDLICGLALLFLCGLLSVSDDTDYSFLLQTKVSSSKFDQNIFTFNTAVNTAEWASPKIQAVQKLIIAESCLAIHSNA